MHHATNAIALMMECTFWQMVPCLPTTQQKDRAPLFTCICRIINNPEVFRPLGHSNATPSFDAELEILTNGVAIQYRESLAILFTLLTKKKKRNKMSWLFQLGLEGKKIGLAWMKPLVNLLTLVGIHWRSQSSVSSDKPAFYFEVPWNGQERRVITFGIPIYEGKHYL